VPAFGHIGDFGDTLYSLPSVRELGGGVYYAKDQSGCQPFICRIPALKRLLEEQWYIESLSPHSGEKIDHDFSDFRQGGFPYGVTLGELHASWVGAKPQFDQAWIEVDPDPRTKGKIVIARSARYRNPYFPWGQLVEKFAGHMLFVGVRAEHVDFVKMYGHVPWLPTNDLYEVASAICGSELFIGNQSAPGAICEGLKHRSIQETCLWVPDCIYPRPNATHCCDGGLKFSVLGMDFESEPFTEAPTLNTQETPNGGWKVMISGQSSKGHSFKHVKREIINKLRESGSQVPEDLDMVIAKQSGGLVYPSGLMHDIERVKSLIREKYAYGWRS
jgi:hypothetical protein